jgi:hypothetical protein
MLRREKIWKEAWSKRCRHADTLKAESRSRGGHEDGSPACIAWARIHLHYKI